MDWDAGKFKKQLPSAPHGAFDACSIAARPQ
jgi:hypothetical protein